MLRLDEMGEEAVEAAKDFFMWFIRAGRGFGKTWVGANWINEGAEFATGEYMGLLGRDAHDVRAFMVEGDSGICSVAHSEFYPKYEPSKRLITWPNGVKAQLFYAEEPKTVRGPNNFRGWADEPASFKDAHLGLKGPNGEDTAMSNFLMTLRIGHPQLCVTGTPKPLKLVTDLLSYEGAFIVMGGTRENRGNLSPRWLKEMEKQYEGTRLGKQELDGEVLDDAPGALWRRAWIQEARLPKHPESMDKVAVALDPSASSTEEANEAGIIVAGRYWNAHEERYHFFVLEDGSLRGTPNQWAKEAVRLYKAWLADVVVGERNNGGEMVEAIIRNVDPNVHYDSVWASRGKQTRAEPIAALYEQGRVHHVGSANAFTLLEDQLCNWQPGMPSPDRLDALVWVLTMLLEGGYVESDAEAFDDFFKR